MTSFCTVSTISKSWQQRMPQSDVIGCTSVSIQRPLPTRSLNSHRYQPKLPAKHNTPLGRRSSTGRNTENVIHTQT